MSKARSESAKEWRSLFLLLWCAAYGLYLAVVLHPREILGIWSEGGLKEILLPDNLVAIFQGIRALRQLVWIITGAALVVAALAAIGWMDGALRACVAVAALIVAVEVVLLINIRMRVEQDSSGPAGGVIKRVVFD